MKRNILCFFVLLLLHLQLTAQMSIGADPAINEQTFAIDLREDFHDLVIHSSMVNFGNATASVKWVRVISDIPTTWTSQICDNNQCYSEIVSSNVDPMLNLNAPILLAPNEHGTLDVHVNPHGTLGTGVLMVEFYESSDETTLISTASFTFHVQDINVSVSEVEKAALQLYPNPSPDYFQLTNANIVNRIVMYNIVGRVVKTFNVYGGDRFDISSLPNGMYLVSLINEDEGVMKTIRLNKRSSRP